MSQIEKIVDEMDWALVKVKGDITLSVTGVAGEHVTCSVIQPVNGRYQRPSPCKVCLNRRDKKEKLSRN